MYDIDKLKARTNKCGKPFYSPLQILGFRIKNWKEKKNWPPSLDELRQRWAEERYCPVRENDYDLLDPREVFSEEEFQEKMKEIMEKCKTRKKQE